MDLNYCGVYIEAHYHTIDSYRMIYGCGKCLKKQFSSEFYCGKCGKKYSSYKEPIKTESYKKDNHDIVKKGSDMVGCYEVARFSQIEGLHYICCSVHSIEYGIDYFLKYKDFGKGGIEIKPEDITTDLVKFKKNFSKQIQLLKNVYDKIEVKYGTVAYYRGRHLCDDMINFNKNIDFDPKLDPSLIKL